MNRTVALAVASILASGAVHATCSPSQVSNGVCSATNGNDSPAVGVNTENTNANNIAATSTVSSRNSATSGSRSVAGASSNQSQRQSQQSSSQATGGAGTGFGQGGSVTSIDQSTYREAANVVQPATMIIQGCQVQGQAGGSSTRASAMLGIGFTPDACYDYIQAQAYLAIGQRQAACEILNHTPAAERAKKHGAVLPSCEPPATVVVPSASTSVAPLRERLYTSEEVSQIVRKAVSK